MQSQYLQKLKLPNKPGVYFFKKGTEIVYIGKATSLRDRVKSYFGKDLIETRGPLLVDMMFQANKIDYQETDSVLEAIILEAFLIKKHQPKYNTKEKSNKSFNYVCITKETFPKVLIVRERGLQKKQQNFSRLTLPRVLGGTHTTKNSTVSFASTYGPFTNGSQLRDAMKIIRRIFPYIDVQSSKKDNFEFYRQLGLTPDVGNKELESAYKKNITNLKLFFQGKKKRIISNFKKEMMQYAKGREFERAQEMKKRIFALTHINDVALLKDEGKNHQYVSSGLTLSRVRGGTHTIQKHTDDFSFRIEAYDIAHMGGKNMVGVMTVIDLPAGRQEMGEVNKNEYKKFKIRTQSDANDTGALYEVLSRRLRHTEWQYPNLIVVDGSTAQINVAKRAIKEVNVDIPIVSVIKDDRHRAKDIGGDKVLGRKYEREILLVNSEAHRFSIAFHKKTRNKNFLK